MHFDSLHMPESELALLETDPVFASLDEHTVFDPQLAALMTEEIVRRGYKLAITDGVTVRCVVMKNGKTQFSVWGADYEDVVCQAAMRIMRTTEV